MRNRTIALAVALALMPLAAAQAADKDAGKENAKRMAQMQRKLTAEKAAVEAQLKEANDKLDVAGKVADEERRRSGALGAKLRHSEDEKQKLATEIEQFKRQLGEQTEAKRKADAEGVALNKSLAEQRESYAQCEAKNLKLYRYGQELLQQYDKKSAWDAMSQREPFTGLKRVEMENMMEDYRDKLDDEKLKSPFKPAAGS